MFFEPPGSGVDKYQKRDPEGRLVVSVICSPSSKMTVTTGKKFGPSIADKVSDENDKSALNGDLSWFELIKEMSV